MKHSYLLWSTLSNYPVKVLGIASIRLINGGKLLVLTLWITNFIFNVNIFIDSFWKLDIWWLRKLMFLLCLNQIVNLLSIDTQNLFYILRVFLTLDNSTFWIILYCHVDIDGCKIVLSVLMNPRLWGKTRFPFFYWCNRKSFLIFFYKLIL